MVILRYDWIGAYNTRNAQGKPYVHPLVDLEEMGYEVQRHEAVDIADATFVEVEKVIEPLPSYIKLAHPDFKFTV